MINFFLWQFSIETIMVIMINRKCHKNNTT